MTSLPLLNRRNHFRSFKSVIEKSIKTMRKSQEKITTSLGTLTLGHGLVNLCKR